MDSNSPFSTCRAGLWRNEWTEVGGRVNDVLSHSAKAVTNQMENREHGQLELAPRKEGFSGETHCEIHGCSEGDFLLRIISIQLDIHPLGFYCQLVCRNRKRNRIRKCKFECIRSGQYINRAERNVTHTYLVRRLRYPFWKFVIPQMLFSWCRSSFNSPYSGSTQFVTSLALSPGKPFDAILSHANSPKWAFHAPDPSTNFSLFQRRFKVSKNAPRRSFAT